jgi:ribosomal protein S27AE
MLKEKYDLSGHFYGSDQEYLDQTITSAISSYKTIQYFSNKSEDTVLSKEDIEYYKKREKLGVQLDECSHCGNTVYLQNNSNIWIATEPCPFPTGLPAYFVEIDKY